MLNNQEKAERKIKFEQMTAGMGKLPLNKKAHEEFFKFYSNCHDFELYLDIFRKHVEFTEYKYASNLTVEKQYRSSLKNKRAHSELKNDLTIHDELIHVTREAAALDELIKNITLRPPPKNEYMKDIKPFILGWMKGDLRKKMFRIEELNFLGADVEKADAALNFKCNDCHGNGCVSIILGGPTANVARPVNIHKEENFKYLTYGPFPCRCKKRYLLRQF